MDGKGSQRPSTAVIEAVASKGGADPLELPCLYDVIDPDALDTLFHDNYTGDGGVTFKYAGYNVTVESDGTVALQQKAVYRETESAYQH